MFSRPQIQQFDNSAQQPQTVKKPWFLLAVIALLVILLGIAAFLFVQSQSQISKLEQALAELDGKQPSVLSATDSEVAQLLEEVGQLIVLPSDEQPTVATVEDLTQLAGQPFFEQAAVGDKVIIYSKAAKAILYRPAEKKVINLAPIINDVAPQETSPAQETPSVQ